MFFTPPSSRPEVEPDNKRKREDTDPAHPQEAASYASPDLKRGKKQAMKRTPQPTLAQSRLTSNGGTLKIQGAGPATSQGNDGPRGEADTGGCVPPSAAATGGVSAMEVVPSNPPDTQGLLVGSGPVPLTAELIRNLNGENTKMVTEKIETLSKALLTFSRKIDRNREGINRTTRLPQYTIITLLCLLPF